MKLSRYQPQETELAPEGRYLFEITDDPEQREGRKGVKYFVLKLAINFKDGSRRKFYQNIGPWEERYGDFLIALGGKKDDEGIIDLGDIELVGMEFEAEVVHVKDQKDPLITRERLENIKQKGSFADLDFDDEL